MIPKRFPRDGKRLIEECHGDNIVKTNKLGDVTSKAETWNALKRRGVELHEPRLDADAHVQAVVRSLSVSHGVLLATVLF